MYMAHLANITLKIEKCKVILIYSNKLNAYEDYLKINVNVRCNEYFRRQYCLRNLVTTCNALHFLCIWHTAFPLDFSLHIVWGFRDLVCFPFIFSFVCPSFLFRCLFCAMHSGWNASQSSCFDKTVNFKWLWGMPQVIKNKVSQFIKNCVCVSRYSQDFHYDNMLLMFILTYFLDRKRSGFITLWTTYKTYLKIDLRL